MMLGEQQGVENDWNTNQAFWINAANQMCNAHVADNLVKAQEKLQERSVVWSI